MISFEQALSELLSLAKQLESEMASIEDASGRILASDAIATHNQPPFDASATTPSILANIILSWLSSSP